MSNEAPERIIAKATREGASWKVVRPDCWFGEAFTDVEYIRADLYQKELELFRKLPMSNDIEQIAEARSSGYLRKKLRKAVERRKSTGGIQAGLPTVKVDLYELERILNEHEAAAEIVRAFGVLEGDVEEGIEAAYWEMQARMDPTQTQYPNAGERYAFKMAVRNLFYKLRDPQQPE